MAGYTKIDNDILEQLLKLPGKTGMVYAALMSHRNQKTTLCNPSQETIAEECGMSDRGVRKAIAILIDADLLAAMPQKSRTGKVPNHYYFPTPTGTTVPQGRGTTVPAYRNSSSSPIDRNHSSSKQDEVNKTKTVAYCKKRGHSWSVVDDGRTLLCGKCMEETANNVIPLEA